MFVDKVVELDDDRSYVVLDKTVLDNKTYYYAVRLDDLNNPTNNYLFFEEMKEDGEYYLDPINNEEMKNLLTITFTINFLNMAYDM